MPISAICKGTIVARRDQPAQQGTVADVVLGMIVFVYWHQRSPSYEYIHDLQAIKKPRREVRRGLRIRASAKAKAASSSQRPRPPAHSTRRRW